MNGAEHKLARLFTEQPLSLRREIALSSDQAHYLFSVLRHRESDSLRLFNGMDGEWKAALSSISKRGARAVPEEKLKPQPEPGPEIHLFFAPVKKNRMDFLIEKAVELGVTDFHPVVTQNTEVRKINAERTHKQIIEAAEQCERLDLPDLHTLLPVKEALAQYDGIVLAALERTETRHLTTIIREEPRARAILIGPEGGFTDEERQDLLSRSRVFPASLGENILRAETAALYALSVLKSCRQPE